MNVFITLGQCGLDKRCVKRASGGDLQSDDGSLLHAIPLRRAGIHGRQQLRCIQAPDRPSRNLQNVLDQRRGGLDPLAPLPAVVRRRTATWRPSVIAPITTRSTALVCASLALTSSPSAYPKTISRVSRRHCFPVASSSCPRALRRGSEAGNQGSPHPTAPAALARIRRAPIPADTTVAPACCPACSGAGTTGADD